MREYYFETMYYNCYYKYYIDLSFLNIGTQGSNSSTKSEMMSGVPITLGMLLFIYIHTYIYMFYHCVLSKIKYITFQFYMTGDLFTC